jgi:enamine deaminase RidA (YjgF/YER057c/UK114 family)
MTGQTGDAPQNRLMAEGIEGQTRRAFENIRAVLEAAGGTMADLAQVTLYVTDIDNWSAVTKVWSEYFGDSDTPPTRQTIHVSGFFAGALIEIVGVAVLGDAAG